jgi:hypothetical protein
MNETDREVEQELERFCSEARTRGARLVVLFGSRAKNRHTEESDADVCLVAEDLPEDIFQRRYPCPSGYRFLSVFGFHPDEFLRMLAEGNPFLLDILFEGKVLHDDGFSREARRVYNEALKRFRLCRKEDGWVSE